MWHLLCYHELYAIYCTNIYVAYNSASQEDCGTVVTS